MQPKPHYLVSKSRSEIRLYVAKLLLIAYQVV